jgi:5-methylthioadenosine/S-adenosylhomocysteine deaminase
MATIEGARALQKDDEIGSLEPGKKADLIAFSPQSPHLSPLHRDQLEKLYSTVCYAAYGSDVCDVMVDGRWLMRKGEILSLDNDAVIRQAQSVSEYLIKHLKNVS